MVSKEKTNREMKKPENSFLPDLDLLKNLTGISVGSMSKIFSLAGLRMGWIASRSEEVIDACRNRRDYDTISCGQLDDLFASLALANKEKIFDRKKIFIKKQRNFRQLGRRDKRSKLY